MDRKITFKQAINEALSQEMERDKTVILMGEDVAGGMRNQWRNGRVGRSPRGHERSVGICMATV